MNDIERDGFFEAGVQTHVNEMLATLALGSSTVDYSDEGQVDESVTRARDATLSRQLLDSIVREPVRKAMRIEAIGRLKSLGDAIDTIEGGEDA